MTAILRSSKSLLAENLCLILLAVMGLAALGTFQFHWQPVGEVSSGVMAWWAGLCAISVLNLCTWRRSARLIAQRKDNLVPEVYSFHWQQLLLSGVFVLGCGFRSILPRADVQRFGLLDSWLSSVLLGRAVATVAEVCFVAQWALVLHRIACEADARWSRRVALSLVPLILVAELSSWYAVATTSYLGNSIEESIWTLCAMMGVVSLSTLWTQCNRAHRPFVVGAMILGVLYVAFMCTVDVPMYVTRYLEDEATGREYLPLHHGLADLWNRRHITFAWEAWSAEMPWMTLYFSVGVWFSLALVHLPVPQSRRPRTIQA